MDLALNNLQGLICHKTKQTNQGVGESATLFPGLLHFTLDPILIMLSKAASSSIF